MALKPLTRVPYTSHLVSTVTQHSSQLTAHSSHPASFNARSQVRPNNYGSFGVDGSDETYSLILDPHNEAQLGHALSFNGGNVTVLGGENVGAGPIDFSGMTRAEVWGLYNTGEVKFTNIDDVIVTDTNNTGHINFTNVHASIFNTTNYGKVRMDGGSYLFMAVGGEQFGHVVIEDDSADLEGTFILDKNYGTIEVRLAAAIHDPIPSPSPNIYTPHAACLTPHPAPHAPHHNKTRSGARRRHHCDAEE